MVLDKAFVLKSNTPYMIRDTADVLLDGLMI